MYIIIGFDCNTKKCDEECYSHGKCNNGTCVCNIGYTGPNCLMKSCPNSCFENGKCIEGACKCEKGYEGLDCSKRWVLKGRVNFA